MCSVEHDSEFTWTYCYRDTQVTVCLCCSQERAAISKPIQYITWELWHTINTEDNYQLTVWDKISLLSVQLIILFDLKYFRKLMDAAKFHCLWNYLGWRVTNNLLLSKRMLLVTMMECSQNIIFRGNISSDSHCFKLNLDWMKRKWGRNNSD